MEATDELIETNDFEEIQVAVKQATKITSKLSDLISQLEEFKIDNGETHARTVRQWKKDVKSRYSKWLGHKDNLSEALATKDQRSQKESERRKWGTKQQYEEAVAQERYQQERHRWEEKLQAELAMTEKKLEMEREAKSTPPSYQS